MSSQLRSRAWLLGPVAAIVLTAIATTSAGAADPLAGSQGTDTSLPATESLVRVNGRGAFANLAITVNQTTKLSNQAVSITWTGGTPTKPGPGRFGSNYLQIMQCWGDDDGTNAANPGPPPEQCEQGAVGGTYDGLDGFNQLILSRIISRSTWPNYSPTVGRLDTRSTNVWLPFRAVDGTEVKFQTDPTFNPGIGGGNFWQNPYYNLITTNEVAGAVTGLDGKGAELFEVVTGVESSGLGCGQKTQPVAGSDKKIPKCWIVVVPRGSATAENKGSGFEADAELTGVATSPVAPNSWQNRIAIPIEFNPVDSPCALGADERRIAGSELALPAVASWQPTLCAGGSSSPYSYVPVSDSAARQQLVSGQPGTPGMIVVSQPLSASVVNPAKPVVYAPLTVSGLAIGFNIERNPLTTAPDDAQQLAGVRVADLNLTPRLVAKLLTQSYRQAVTVGNSLPNYPWLAANPSHMGQDPDFRQFNPEFSELQIADGRAFSGLQVPAGNSDVAQQLWEWVLADPEARAWLDGQPDEWGMVVNPVYATVAAVNSTGIAFGDPVPSSFPKADPYCYLGPARGVKNAVVPPPLCGTDWLPYKRSFAETAKVTRAASIGARIVDNPAATSSSEVWKRESPQYLGRRDVLALTDTPSAAQFGLQVARLSRSGDDGTDRSFVAADTEGLTTGVASMTPSSDPSVLKSNPSAVASGAYPLTTVTYAAISPLALDTTARVEYAGFVDYAAGPGQVPGLELGQLPKGYAPLPESLRSQTVATAEWIRTMVPAPEPDPTTPSTPSTVPVPESSTTIATATTTTSAEAAPPVATTATTTRPATSGGGGSPSPNTTRPTAPSPVGPVNSVPVAEPASTEPPVTEPTTATAAAAPSVPVDAADEPASTAPSVITPIVNLAKSRYAVPGLGVMALSSALCALEITKRPRRRGGPGRDVALDETIDVA